MPTRFFVPTRISAASVFFSSLVYCLLAGPVSAGIGLSEWTIKTPGKNCISDVDALSDQHGVCLHVEVKRGESLDKDAVRVSHIQWWQYYKGFVVGHAKKGLFIFDERKKKVQYYQDRGVFENDVKALEPTKPASQRMKPQDGFNKAMGATMKVLYEKQLKEIDDRTGTYKDMTTEQRASMRKTIEQFLKTLE